MSKPSAYVVDDRTVDLTADDLTALVAELVADHGGAAVGRIVHTRRGRVLRVPTAVAEKLGALPTAAPAKADTGKSDTGKAPAKKAPAKRAAPKTPADEAADSTETKD